MTKQEFEDLALIDSMEIGPMLYESVEHFYMSDNDYHAKHGGVDEDKQSFVTRVFGGKVNTPATIACKLAKEASRENRHALQGNIGMTDQRLNEMDQLIADHYGTILNYAM